MLIFCYIFFLWLQLDALEYIHSKEYIHADIKASNLLVGHKAGTENQVFLVDFGLACRYAYDGKHKEYKYDQRKAHDGTIEFTSRDAHIGGEWKLDLAHFFQTSMCISFTSNLPWFLVRLALSHIQFNLYYYCHWLNCSWGAVWSKHYNLNYLFGNLFVYSQLVSLFYFCTLCVGVCFMAGCSF